MSSCSNDVHYYQVLDCNGNTIKSPAFTYKVHPDSERVFNLVRWRFHKRIDNRFPDPRTFDERMDEVLLNRPYGYTRKATRLNIQHSAR